MMDRKNGKTHSTKYSIEEINNNYYNLVEPRLEEISMWLYEGKMFGEIASELGIPNSMLWAMRTNQGFTELREIFKNKNMLNENVEFALYRKAIGYFVEEEVPMKVKRKYINKMEKECTREEIQIVKVKKYIAPDFNAQRFYLLNHMSEAYHPENAKQEDDTIDKLIDNAQNILVQVKKVAEDDTSK